ncbi:MAG: nucleotide sugar dehydrogenase [Rothia sp. (in: high G+C Gram-positive bacteria)]|nr:nucleotide sugar dehydrogenase [Rothia sp. (in: high G+C Gram-positive bacteria)]
MTHLVVIGQGYVGLPLAQEASRSGLKVTGLDRSSAIVESLNAGRSHIDDLSDQDISQMLDMGYQASNQEQVIAEADYVVICVPTPLGQDGSPDLTPVKEASKSIAAHLRPGTTVILESTTYPGTTDTLVAGILEEAGHKLDQDYYLAFSPERIDPGNPTFGLKNTPKVVGGVSPQSTERAVALYSQFIDQVVPVAGAREAETAKLLENTYRHINIALVNEMAKFCHDLKIDLWDVIRAAATKPFGFQAFYPGPGVGGHCIPIDPNYLSYEVKRSLGYPFRFVELAQEINLSMPKYITERVMELLNEQGQSLKGAKVLLLGVTYKANISDQRESPAVPLAQELLKRGAQLSYHDPYVENWSISQQGASKVHDLQAGIAEADIVLLLQKHRDYDADALAAQAKIFFDTRGASSSDQAVRL